MNLLFVCSENRLRSPTAEAVFSRYPGIHAIGAGTNATAETPVSAVLIAWADVVFVMERRHAETLAELYPEALQGKRLVCLDIPDRYGYMHPELVRLLQDKVRAHVPLAKDAPGE